MKEQGFFIDSEPILDIEAKILHVYTDAIYSVLCNRFIARITYDRNFDIKLKAADFLPKGIVLENTNQRRLYIVDKKILQKYAAYIWHDNYIYYGLGMLLNNADNKTEANCIFEDGVIKTARDIEKGEYLKIDYGYNIVKYPPIPSEIMEIRLRELKNT